jgi:hypothetical protein
VTDRHFTDKSGVRWRIRNVVSHTPFQPLQPASSMQFRPPRMYLLFESERETRRLAPTPPKWQDASDQELADMLSAAVVVTIRPPKP